LDRINQILDEANNFHPNIKLVRQIGTSLSFLDVFIENKNGLLTTSVYHKAAAEPYIVPFQSDHPRHVFKNIIETALLRAIRYSSTLTTFNSERGSIKLMLLYNGFVLHQKTSSVMNSFLLVIHLDSSMHDSKHFLQNISVVRHCPHLSYHGSRKKTNS